MKTLILNRREWTFAEEWLLNRHAAVFLFIWQRDDALERPDVFRDALRERGSQETCAPRMECADHFTLGVRNVIGSAAATERTISLASAGIGVL